MAANAVPTAARRTTAPEFLEENPLKSIFRIPEDALDAVMATAYQLYQVGRYAEVEILCRGLIAADHKYWWSYSLLAATLRRLGRLQEALAEIERGLGYEPGSSKLVVMRDELRQVLANRPAPPPHKDSQPNPPIGA